MTDPIETIRGYASMLPAVLYYQSVRDALAALEAELKRLRDDPNILDLSIMLEGWTVDKLILLDDGQWLLCLYTPTKASEWFVGPTPRAALAAAIERMKP